MPLYDQTAAKFLQAMRDGERAVTTRDYDAADEASQRVDEALTEFSGSTPPPVQAPRFSLYREAMETVL